MFEYVYFARPDSIISDINVARVRTAMGRELARLHPVEADIVVPVPDSGNYAALGFAEELGIPVQPRLCAQSLHRPHLSPADAAHPRFQRAGEAEPHQGGGGRESAWWWWMTRSCAAPRRARAW